MANRVTINDNTLDIDIQVAASGSYAPDVMNDLCARVKDLYQETAAYKHALFADAYKSDEE